MRILVPNWVLLCVIWDSTCYVSLFLSNYGMTTIEGNFNKQEWLYAKQHVKKDGT